VYFHVEISAGIQHARVFNLNREDMLGKVIGPWLEGRSIEMGDREWLPRECTLRVLEGPLMETPDLSFGQGWANAQRRSEDVTRRLLEDAPAPAPVQAFEVEADPSEVLTALSNGKGEAVPISLIEARERIDRRDPKIAAVVLVTRAG
jgi:hypothetical protein